jgi:hypothetical protein
MLRRIAIGWASSLVVAAGCASAPPCPCRDAPAEAGASAFEVPTGSTEVAPSPSEPSEVAPERPSVCTSDEHRQFDFWRGEWEVHTGDGKRAGHNRIEAAHGGCALIEHWESARGGSGTSTNYYDPAKRKWVQNWVDANGSVIQLEGGPRDGAIWLEGRYVTPDGTERKMRGIWTPLEDGRVRQRFETSTEGGGWKLWFEGFYRRVDGDGG